jgi:hypothetical protein
VEATKQEKEREEESVDDVFTSVYTMPYRTGTSQHVLLIKFLQEKAMEATYKA